MIRTSTGRACALWLVLALMGATCPGAATAVPLYQAYSKYYGTAGCCHMLEQDTSPVGLYATQVATEMGWYSVSASAAPGNAMVWGQNYLSGSTSFNVYREMTALASFDDLVFTDGTGVPKQVTFWLHIEASGSTDVSAVGAGQAGCVYTEAAVSAAPGAYPSSYHGVWFQEGSQFNCPYPSGGFFAGETGAQLSKSLRVGPFYVQSEEPITIEMRSTITPAPVLSGGGSEMTVTGNLYFQLSQVTAAIESPGFEANSQQAGIVNNVVANPVSVGPVATPELGLAQSVPNPARAGATIAFDLPRAGVARLALYDVTGREVRRLGEGWRAAGAHSIRWDGRDASGRSVPPGIYLYRLRADGETRTRSLVVAR